MKQGYFFNLDPGVVEQHRLLAKADERALQVWIERVLREDLERRRMEKKKNRKSKSG